MHQKEAKRLKRALETLGYVGDVVILPERASDDYTILEVGIPDVTEKRPERIVNFTKAWLNASVAHNYILRLAEIEDGTVRLGVK